MNETLRKTVVLICVLTKPHIFCVDIKDGNTFDT